MTTPQWALERIQEAKEKNQIFLNLSREATSSLDPLTEIPNEVFELFQITKLDLSRNLLNNLPGTITKLQNLTELLLSYNEVSCLPESITELENLTSLNLMSNQLTDLPEQITKLQNLIRLGLSGNQLTDLPESISNLHNLEVLYLNVNLFAHLPESITNLPKLTTLWLGDNSLISLPESITKLKKLTTLLLGHNPITSLPKSISKLENLIELDLKDNKLITPPQEVAIKGIEAIREYFRQMEEQGQDQLYEAKLLILGEGGAGKTTLVKKIGNPDYVLQDETSTEGVDVTFWSFPMDEEKSFRVNIWDFGGQEIYHATHQFFLTKRSLYALVADTRKEDTDFYYWLNVVELLSDNSPILIIKNEKQDRHRDLNERQLRGQFENLKEISAVNLATNRGLDKVRDEIEYYIKSLSHIGSPLPKTWVRVRERLENDKRNYISLEWYLKICEENGFADAKDSLQLSNYLNDIGVFLHFQDEPLLKKTVILKPK